MKAIKKQWYLGVIILTSALALGSCNNKKGQSATDNAVMCSAMVGDLVITEIMANPLGKDSGREWFEIYNASDKDQILNKLLISQNYAYGNSTRSKEYVVKSDQNIIVKPGEYFVFGDSNSDWVNFNYEKGLAAFPANDTTLSLLCNNKIIDSVTYAVTPTEDQLSMPEEGMALAFDGTRIPDAMANDKGSAWCNANTIYDVDGNMGTPGKANDACQSASSCIDNDQSVAHLAINPGDLVFSEIMANPFGSDGKREYIELYNTTGSELDLYNLRVEITVDGSSEPKQFLILGKDETVKNRKSCIRTAKSYILIGNSMDHAENGDLDIDAILSGSLPNGSKSSTTMIYSLYSGSTLISETPIFKAPKDGEVWMLNSKCFEDPTSTDSWCAIAYDKEQEASLGTPGEENYDCETIDSNTEIIPPDPPKECTGTAPAAGDLIISEIYSNPTGSSGTDYHKEFVEIYATKAVTVDSLQIQSKTSATAKTSRKFNVTFEDCYTFTPGSYVVFDAMTDADNVSYTRFSYSGSKDGLHQPKDGYLLELYSGETLISQVPNALGNTSKTAQLSNDSLSAAASSDVANWCAAAPTPGTANTVCEKEVPPEPCSSTKPAKGDLIITEIYSAASVTEEFIEFYVKNSIRTNNIKFISKTNSGSRSFTAKLNDCQTFNAGEYIVLDAHDEDYSSLVDYTRYSYNGTSSGIYNPNKKNGAIIELYADDQLIDVGPNFQGNANNSAQLSGDKLNSGDAHTDDANWCAASPTPGTNNGNCTGQQDNPPICETASVIQEDDVIISEFYPNPKSEAGVDEPLREFVELYTFKDIVIDSMRFESYKRDSTTKRVFNVKIDNCQSIAKNTYILLVASLDSSENGGITNGDFLFTAKDSDGKKGGIHNPTTTGYNLDLYINDVLVNSSTNGKLETQYTWARSIDPEHSIMCASNPTPGYANESDVCVF